MSMEPKTDIPGSAGISARETHAQSYSHKHRGQGCTRSQGMLRRATHGFFTTCAIGAFVFASGVAAAQEKFTPAPYDPFVGDWESQTPVAPVAQVIRTGSNAYTVNVLAAFDDDTDTAPIAVLQGARAAGADEKSTIELRGGGGDGAAWTAEMWPDCCSAPHLELVNTRTKQILRLRQYMRPNPLLRVKPPANATVLFGIDGHNDPGAWIPISAVTARWKPAENGYVFECEPGAGSIASRENFGDQRVHLEFRFPGSPASACVHVHGIYRVTLNESYARYDLPPSGAIEKTAKTAGIKPAARASRPVLEWQSLDIDFRAPLFSSLGIITTPAKATVYLNNVLLYENVELIAPIGSRATPRGPLVLEARDAPVQFRNIWVQPVASK